MHIPSPTRVRVRRFVRKVRKTGTFEWQNFWRSRPIQDDTVLYESFAGNGMLCNPEAIFRGLRSDPGFAHLKHVWVLSDPERYRSTMDRFAHDGSVTFVRRHSAAYFRALATSKYLINNATFPWEFCKREGQVYLNTWHGTPLKTMGYDSPEGGRGATNVVRNFLMADFLLSSGPFMTQRMYQDGFRLTNLFRGRIVTEGFPRVDEQFLTDLESAGLRQRLRDSGLAVGETDRLVLFVPTWRGTSFHAPTNDVALLGEQVRAVRAGLPKGHQVLLKVHQQVYGFALEHPDLADILVPNEIPTNQVLGLTDVLVTDYSSAFFDFLATGRPIIFFTPDPGRFGERGIYLDAEQLPGPTARTVPELIRLIRAVGTHETPDPEVTHREVYANARQRFAAGDDGSSAKRVIDVVFRGSARHDVAPLSPDGRESIVIYLGGLRSNGITASALNLLANIDHDRFDVTAFYAEPDDLERRHNEARIDPRVRVFPRVGGIIPSKKDRWNRRRLQTIGVDAPRLDLDSMRAVFGQEWRRCFGEARFDHVIDYSGYASYWAFLLLQAPARSRSIWLHSDLRSDQMREVDGHRPHEANLRAVFSMYPAFDHLVSVSPALCRMNATNLSDVVAKEKHTWARNSINVEQILRLGRGVDAVDHGRPPPVVLPDTLSEAMSALAQRYGIEGLVAEVERLQIVDRFARRHSGAFTFVTVGRLSPEKNDDRLIEAFDLVRQEHPLARLVIVGGGPMLDELKTRVDRLGLSEVVTIAGQQANPYAIMAQCDCFVLSSDYEGHPMVFLEARVLGLPIVSTDFPSINGALPEGAGLVVSRDTQALAAGMRSALAGEVPTKPFDAAAYNAEVIAEFYSAIGARS